MAEVEAEVEGVGEYVVNVESRYGPVVHRVPAVCRLRGAEAGLPRVSPEEVEAMLAVWQMLVRIGRPMDESGGYVVPGRCHWCFNTQRADERSVA